MPVKGSSSHPRIADRMGEIQPFHAMALLARARDLEAQGRSIIHMEVGEPDFDTPAPIVEAGLLALRTGHTHYTPAVGLTELRESIARFYAQRYGVDVEPRQIVVTPGASGALQLVMGVLVNPGDEVLMADPGYPCNRHFVRLMEGRPVSVPVGPETGYQLNGELVARHWSQQTVAAMLASPSNPTGTLVGAGELGDIAQVAADRGGRLIVDEIYHGLVYGGDAGTALAVDSTAFVLNSFSKYFGMTGWRIGWLVVPDGYMAAVDKLAQNIFLAASTPAQYAALAAFEPETIAILDQRRSEFQRRRDFLVPALRELGFDIPAEPQGAFYIYADCSRLTSDSFDFALRLLEEAGVAVTPGIDFGTHNAGKYIRFAYTTSLDRLAEGVDRLAEFVA